MRHFLGGAALCAAAISASPSAAQETAPPPAFVVSGSVGLISDYRLRGVSQTDKEAAIQGGLTLSHESGLYGSFWASNLAGWGTFGGSNLELDLIGGYKKTVGPATVDVGLTWYMYPGGSDKTDYAEPYVKVSGTVGPASLLVGVAYAPKQEAIGRWYFSGASYATGIPDRPGAKNDNIYVWGDGAVAIPSTPLTAKAHVGYSSGNSGLGPNGTSIAPTGKYLDYGVGMDFTLKPVTFNVSFIGTDIKKSEYAYLLPNFSSTKNGSSISSGKVVFSISAGF